MMVSRLVAFVAIATGILLGTAYDGAQSLAQTGAPARVVTREEIADFSPEVLPWDATPEVTTDAFREASYSSASCSTCGLDACGGGCYRPATLHSSGFFADALYLRPGNVDVTYTVELTGCDPLLSSPTGPTGRVGPDAQLGVRAGFVHALSDCASIVGSYTWYDSSTSNAINAQPGMVLAMQVSHPSLANCGTNSLSASANYDIDFRLVDLDYRKLIAGDCNWAVNWIGGLRYGWLNQQFTARQNTGVATGLSTVSTDVDFEGFGFRLGLDGERLSTQSGLLIYARGVANFLGGETKARYRQVNQFGGAIPVGYDAVDYRIVSLLEAELGIGWQSHSGHWRFTTGYQTNAWFNSLTTGGYIRGVRAGSTDNLSDTLTFDGLVARVEWRH